MIITLPDHELSNSAAARCKHYWKILTGVDRTSRNGYAFQGRFAGYGETIDVPEGAWLMSYMEDRRASGRLDWITVTLYRATDGTLKHIEGWNIDGEDRGWALHCRDAIHTHMTTPAPAVHDLDALRAERDRITARLAEIDAILNAEPQGA